MFQICLTMITLHILKSIYNLVFLCTRLNTFISRRFYKYVMAGHEHGELFSREKTTGHVFSKKNCTNFINPKSYSVDGNNITKFIVAGNFIQTKQPHDIVYPSVLYIREEG